MSDPNRKAEKIEAQRLKQEKYLQDTDGLEFKEWPKIARLNRDIVITEKIDGTNAAIGILMEPTGIAGAGIDSAVKYRVYAQSRNRILTPENDNFGFAAWVKKHEQVLIEALGEGIHFGEWWGVGIGRGYGLSERRFSLFNTSKWADKADGPSEGALALDVARAKGVAIYSVPILYTGPWSQLDRFVPDFVLMQLKAKGSIAAPFDKPEGIVVFHGASGTMFKATCEKDEQHKGNG